MTAGKGQLVGRLQVQVGAVGSRQRHGLSEIVIKVVVELVLAVLTFTTENVNIVTASLCLDDTIGTKLVAPCLRLQKVHLTDGCRQLFTFHFYLFTPQELHLKRMLTHHHRMVGGPVNTNRIVRWESGVVFMVVCTAVERLAYTGIRS